MDEFEEWLSDRLRFLKTDEATFCPYIKSILEETDEDLDEKIEGLDGILQELKVADVEAFRNEIFTKWNSAAAPQTCSPNGSKFINQGLNVDVDNTNGDKAMQPGDGDSQFDELLRCAATVEMNVSSLHNPPVNTMFGGQPDQQLRAAILSHLSSGSSGSDDEQAEPKPGGSVNTAKKKGVLTSSLPNVGRNANVEKVLSEQKELKDRAKAEHQKKKERDKEDRAKQKASAQDRKDKAKKKSAKVERKR